MGMVPALQLDPKLQTPKAWQWYCAMFSQVIFVLAGACQSHRSAPAPAGLHVFSFCIFFIQTHVVQYTSHGCFGQDQPMLTKKALGKGKKALRKGSRKKKAAQAAATLTSPAHLQMEKKEKVPQRVPDPRQREKVELRLHQRWKRRWTRAMVTGFKWWKKEIEEKNSTEEVPKPWGRAKALRKGQSLGKGQTKSLEKWHAFFWKGF